MPRLSFTLTVLGALIAWSPSGPASEPVRPATAGGFISGEMLVFLEEFGIGFETLPVIRPTALPVLQDLHFEGRAHVAHQEVAALYMPHRNEILIDAAFAPGDALGQSYVIHELVHMHQFGAGKDRTSSCRGMLEADAYAMQAAFLRRNDQPGLALMFDLVGQLQAGCTSTY